MIPVPPSLPEVLFLPGTDVRYVHTAELILSHAERVFKPYTVTEKTLFCITRNADITPTDEAFELDQDFRAQMKKLLRQRTKLAPVRLELSSNVSSRFTQYFCDKLQLSKKQLYVTSSPMQMKYVFSLPDRVSQALQQELTYPPFTPQPTAGLTPGESVLKQVMKRDVLLSYPYESMDPFLQMLREAARDPAVLSIKITIYRLARKAKLVDYLCAAAENGKDVTVMIELRARFDEQNNIDWSQRLEDAGCRILYGFDGYKVHSKSASSPAGSGTVSCISPKWVPATTTRIPRSSTPTCPTSRQTGKSAAMPTPCLKIWPSAIWRAATISCWPLPTP